MARIQKDDLDGIRDQRRAEQGDYIRIGMSTGGLAAGSEAVYQKLLEGIQERELNVSLLKAGCMGLDFAEPLVEVNVAGAPRTIYGNVTPETAELILDSHVMFKRVVKRLVVEEAENFVNCHDADKPEKTKDGVVKQYRIVTRNFGLIDPEDLNDYIGVNGFQALKKALFEMTPQGVIDEIKAAGLRGRGGAGFPTGVKWDICRKNEAEQHYVICNGDEGDPGAYMDRGVLESDPFSVIEGMMLAGYAVGATQGFFYVRAEYPLAIERIENAIRQCKRSGLLGKGSLGSDFSFDLEVRLGAGAFVCGEETALIASVEGKRGTPSPRPPFPAAKGLWGMPTVINNVETLANVAPIVEKGSKWFTGIGLGKSTGTKVFALTGKVQHPGLVEIPMGTPLRDIVFGIGGGGLDGKTIKAVQTGGPSGGLIPAELFDTPVTYEHLAQVGSIVGSGGMIVMDDGDSIVDIVKFYLGFCVEESCGKCAPCRIGGKQMLLILERLADGKGVPQDMDHLRRICRTMKAASLCGLGQSAPNPVMSSMRYFDNEYREALARAQGA